MSSAIGSRVSPPLLIAALAMVVGACMVAVGPLLSGLLAAAAVPSWLSFYTSAGSGGP